MEEQQIQILADAMWEYFHDKYLLPYLSDSMCYFMATVTTAPAGGVIGVARPFDNTITLPYAWSAETLQAGDTCMVLVFGDLTNAIVIGKGDLSEPGIYVTKAGLLQSTGSAADNTMSQNAITTALSGKANTYAYTFTTSNWTGSGTSYALTLLASAHGCGTEPSVQIFKKNGTAYENAYGFPSEGWKLSVNANGDITVTASAAFDGKLVVR